MNAAPALDALSPWIKQACLTSASKLIFRPEFGELLVNRPIEIEKICTCSDTLLKQDVRLAQYLNVDDSLMQRRLSDAKVQGYLIMRIFDSLLKCAQPEIASALDAAVLP